MRANKVTSILSKLAICGIIGVQFGLPVVTFGQTNPPNLVAQTSTADDPELSEVEQLNQQVIQLDKQGKYAEAIPLAQRTLAITEKVLGPEHPDVALSLNNLAELYQDQGNYKEAEPLFQRALAIKEKVLGPEHPHVALSLNNLAGLYKDQGNYSEAESLYQRSLAISEKVLGPEHLDVAASLNNLATLHWGQDNIASTIELLTQS